MAFFSSKVRRPLGDRKAFGMLYDATSAKLFGVCLRVLENRGEAEVDLDQVGEIAEPEPGPEAKTIARSEVRRIKACLDEVPEDSSGAVRAAYLDGAQ